MMQNSEKTADKTRKVKAVRTEVYSRVVGYYRPVQDWNKGKREEFQERKYIEINELDSPEKTDN